MLGGGLGEVQQLLGDRIVKGRLETVPQLDSLSGGALFHPDLLPISVRHPRPPHWFTFLVAPFSGRAHNSDAAIMSPDGTSLSP